MPSSYHIVEPHPSTTTAHAVNTSRGGAGNVVPLNKTNKPTSGPSASGPASVTRLGSNQRKQHASGRGGAGNVFSSTEHTIFSFDEELEWQLQREKHAAPVFHVGRGGAGNLVLAQPSTSDILNRKWSNSSTVDSDASSSSNNSSTVSSSSESTSPAFIRKKSMAARWDTFMGVRS